MKSKPLLSSVACLRLETCLALKGRAGEELGKAPPQFGGAGAGLSGSFPEWVDLPSTLMLGLYSFAQRYRYFHFGQIVEGFVEGIGSSHAGPLQVQQSDFW